MDVVASFPRASAARRSRFAFVPVYWHLLSFDAPTVAVLWAWSLAHAVRVSPAASSLAVLGIGTWLIYVADRLLDGRAPQREDELRERHYFHARHARALQLAGVAACAPLLFFIMRMPAAERREDAWIFAAVIAYSALVHQRFVRIRFPREVIVACVFASACAVPAWSGSGDLRLQLVALAGVFGALCFLNCSAIHAWEHPQRRWAHVTLLALCVAAGAIGATFTMRTVEGVRLGVALLASALLLMALDRDQRRALKRHPAALSPLALRILADAALLTPLLLVPWKL